MPRSGLKRIRRVALRSRAQTVAQVDAQDIEIQEESVSGTEDISAQASAQQDRGAQWAAFSANESSATDFELSDAESDAGEG